MCFQKDDDNDLTGITSVVEMTASTAESSFTGLEWNDSTITVDFDTKAYPIMNYNYCT